MQRRTFIQRGLLGGALLLVGSAGGLALRSGDRSRHAAGELGSIDAKVFPVLAAVAARVLDGTSASPVAVAMKIDASLQNASPEARKDINSVLLLLENSLGGLFLRGSATPFTLLDEAEQDAALYSWRDSRIVLLRSAYQALRKLALAAHYATPASWAEVGFPGPSVPKPEPPPISARGPLHVVKREPELPDGGRP